MSGSKLRLGLALGSGVARGWAHIGVLRTLKAAGFEPDVIAGTSIGAVAGGAFAAGKMEELEEFAIRMTRRRLLSLLDLRFRGGGLFGGSKLGRILKTHLGETQIEDLPLKFISVTTELATGHEIWLQKGSLVESLRASYVLPGVFSPVRIGGRWLIDGALVNPVPASVCRAFGARLVIAVNLNRDVFGKSASGKAVLENVDWEEEEKKEETPQRTLMRQIFGSSPHAPGLTTVMLSALNIVQDRLARSRLAGDPPDVTIAPRIGHISLLEFDKAQEAIDLGSEATEAVLPQLREAAGLLT